VRLTCDFPRVSARHQLPRGLGRNITRLILWRVRGLGGKGRVKEGSRVWYCSCTDTKAGSYLCPCSILRKGGDGEEGSGPMQSDV